MSLVLVSVQDDGHDVVRRMSSGRKSSLTFARFVYRACIDLAFFDFADFAGLDPHDGHWIVKDLGIRFSKNTPEKKYFFLKGKEIHKQFYVK